MKQKFTVRITDPAARYGMQATARLESNLNNGQAGKFTPLSNAMWVSCVDDQDRPPSGCPPSTPVEFINHSDPNRSNTFTFEWTPPASQTAGAVIIYVAANASNGPAPNGAKVHLKSLRLQPGAGGGGVRPTIFQGGIISAGAFGAVPQIAPGSWIEIFGKDFTTVVESRWDNAFNNGVAPTNLSNTRVTVDGKPAFVAFLNPSQVNVQVPDGIASGPVVQIKVISPGGESDPITVTGQARAPGILAPPSFRSASGKQYVVAELPESTITNRVFAGPPGFITGLNFKLPKPGDRLVIYGVGFGATNPPIPSGTVVTQANSIPGLQIQLGSATVTAEYSGLAPSAVGLYQFNIVVPNVQAGDHEISMSVGSIRTQTSVFLAVGN